MSNGFSQSGIKQSNGALFNQLKDTFGPIGVSHEQLLKLCKTQRLQEKIHDAIYAYSNMGRHLPKNDHYLLKGEEFMKLVLGTLEKQPTICEKQKCVLCPGLAKQVAGCFKNR